MKYLPLLIVATLPLAACSWGIKLDSGGNKVRTAWNGDVGGCKEMGKITVSVLDHVGPVDRRDLKVRDELEVMARNEAAERIAHSLSRTCERLGLSSSFHSIRSALARVQ